MAARADFGGASMKYQICIEAAQAPDEAPGGRVGAEFVSCDQILIRQPGLPATTSIILTKPSCCSNCCRAAHTAAMSSSLGGGRAIVSNASRFNGRNMAIAAYDAADPILRDSLDVLARAMTTILEATREELLSNMPPEATGCIGEAVAARLA
jgi:hypothetical protein